MPTATRRTAGALLLGLGLALTGCGGTEPLNGAPDEGKSPRVRMPVSTDKHPVPIEVMDRLYAEVSEASGHAPGDIELVRAEHRSFRDTSLDCPQPNVGYAQVIIEGYWVILRAGGEEFDYRVNNKREHFRCTGSTKQAPIKYPPND